MSHIRHRLEEFPAIVAVGGQKLNGKDLLANWLAERLNTVAFGLSHRGTGPVETDPYYHRVNFADPVKDLVAQTFGVSRAFLEHWKNQPEPPPGWVNTVRDALIYFGDGGRRYQPDVWLRRALDAPGRKVISDLRYPNEALGVRARGGLTILLWRPGFENDLPYKSEQGLTEARQGLIAAGVRGRVLGHPLLDFFLVNDGSPERLLETARRCLNPFFGGNL